MRTIIAVVLAAAISAVGLVSAAHWLGGGSVLFAVLVVWLPMVALGSTSHFVTVRLPRRWHELHNWERVGRVYERLGVRFAKAALRRGPLSAFNPGLHLPRQHSAAELLALEGRMCEAEATHVILFVVTISPLVHALGKGWMVAAGVIAGCNLVMNGYPAMLQRYNRVLLRRRFGEPSPTALTVREG